MDTLIRIPDSYKCFPGMIASGFDGRIDYKVAEQIRNKTIFSEFSAWGITGKIWWDKKGNAWHAEIWKKGSYITSLCGETIEDLLFSIQKYCSRKY